MNIYKIEKQIECVKFEDLDDSVKDIVRSNYVDDISSDWYEASYEDFTFECAKIGICVEDMRFSGFWSQGSGAAFEGYVGDLEKFCENIELSALDMRVILKYHSWYGYPRLTATFSRGYGIGQASDTETCGGEQFDRAPVFVRALKHLASAWDDKTQELASKLYHNLESEYEALCSDDRIIEDSEDSGLVYDTTSGECYEVEESEAM